MDWQLALLDSDMISPHPARSCGSGSPLPSLGGVGGEGKIYASYTNPATPGSSYQDLLEMPTDVQNVMGYGLYLAQIGDKHDDAKPLKGFKGAGVLEIVDDFDGDTYRAIYTVRFEFAVYVLHVFQKKSKSGIATPKQDLNLIDRRLKIASELHQQQYENKSS
jgi:phage-related protein